jgi:hypothetical protein
VRRGRGRDDEVAIELRDAVVSFAALFPVCADLVVDELLELLEPEVVEVEDIFET